MPRPFRTLVQSGALLAAAGMLACASPPEGLGETEAVELDGFRARLPTGPDWHRRIDGPTHGVFRELAAEWSHGMFLELTVPPALDEAVHPYDLLAAARINASKLDRERQLEMLQHEERLIRHHGMDCAESRFAMRRAVEIGSETGYDMIVGRGLVCAHPSDRRRIANLHYAVRNLDGRLLAVDEALGDAFLESLRARPID